MAGVGTNARIKRALEQLEQYNAALKGGAADIDIVASGDPFQLPPVLQKPLWHQKNLKTLSPDKYWSNRRKLGPSLQNGLDFWDEFTTCVLLLEPHRVGTSAALKAWLRSQDLLVRVCVVKTVLPATMDNAVASNASVFAGAYDPARPVPPILFDRVWSAPLA